MKPAGGRGEGRDFQSRFEPYQRLAATFPVSVERTGHIAQLFNCWTVAKRLRPALCCDRRV